MELGMPTFYERKAFKDDFRRKWKEDKGMVSMFDKRQQYKQNILYSLKKTQELQRLNNFNKRKSVKQKRLTKLQIGVLGSKAPIEFMKKQKRGQRAQSKEDVSPEDKKSV